ncbi:hypothetical protein [Brevibacillus migulae]|nr:hypothetical protein [Brevibacillus migulae]
MMVMGILLFLVTVGIAIAIAYQANENVRKFDEGEHESFLGRRD